MFLAVAWWAGEMVLWVRALTANLAWWYTLLTPALGRQILHRELQDGQGYTETQSQKETHE